MLEETRPSRRNRRPRLAESVYGRSAYACHIILSTYRRKPVFARRPDLACLVTRLLHEVAGVCGIRLYCYCLMPDHLHVIASVDREGSDLISFVKYFKSRVTREVRGKFSGPLWQRSFYDHVLRNGEDLPAVCEYVLANPVRKALVEPGEPYLHSWLAEEARRFHLANHHRAD